jgi:transglutaminase superfamily protein
MRLPDGASSPALGGVADGARDFLRGGGLKAAMKTWRGFWRLSTRSRGVALQAAAALVATCVGLRLVGLPRWKSVLVWLTPRKATPIGALAPAQIETARGVARIQDAVSRHLIFHASCLEQSLVLWWLLGRRGIPAELRIGARKDAGLFEAHAWVELGTVVLNGSGEAHLHFAPFDGSIISMETQPH